MGNQRTFASMAWNEKGKVTRRERFLAEMDAVIPWPRLVRLIEPHYPKAGQGRQPLGLEKMLRIYFLQQWFNLSDPQAEDAIYDSESMRRFVGVELGDEVVPDETTILRFRHLLDQHGLTEAIFASITGLLEERRLLLRSGTIVDATIIAAPSSTKNASATRDPEMKQTRKGRNWHFGMKLHIGTDKRGIVHTVKATAASVADITQLPDLLHGLERHGFKYFAAARFRCTPRSTHATARCPAELPRVGPAGVCRLPRRGGPNQPRGQEIHLIADNLSAHETKRVTPFLATHPKVHLHSHRPIPLARSG